MFRRLATLAFSAAIVSSSSFAHVPCFTQHAGDNYLDTAVMHGHALLAVQFTVPRCFSATKIEVFSGEASGWNSVALWTDDSAHARPGVELSAGSWSMHPADSWQGAFLSMPVALDCNGTYWMVWGYSDGSQASLDFPESSPGQVFRVSVDGGQSWNGPWQSNDRQWKFRLLGDCLSDAIGFCKGDGTLAQVCPCSNWMGLGRGCRNSANTGGAALLAGGTTADDTLDFVVNGEPPGSLSVLLQANHCNSGGVFFGDGVLCLGGTLRRMYVRNAVNGSLTVPDLGTGDPTLRARSRALGDLLESGAIRFYQVYYRDSDPNFCPAPLGNTWNVSGGMSVLW